MFIFESQALVVLACFCLPAMSICGMIFALSSLKLASDSDDKLYGNSQYEVE